MRGFKTNVERPAKTALRNQLVDLAVALPYGHLETLSLCGADWGFEKALLAKRPDAHCLGIERDRAIYEQACINRQGNEHLEIHRDTIQCALTDLKHFGAKFNVIWLDFCGPICPVYEQALIDATSITTDILAVTFMNMREHGYSFSRRNPRYKYVFSLFPKDFVDSWDLVIGEWYKDTTAPMAFYVWQKQRISTEVL